MSVMKTQICRTPPPPDHIFDISFHLPPQRAAARQGEELHAAAARRRRRLCRTPPLPTTATSLATATRHRRMPYPDADAFADDNGETVRMKVNDPYYILFYTCVTSTNILLSLNLQKIIQEGQIFRGRSLTGILPLSTTQWESMVETHLARYPNKGRTMDGLKRKFKELHIKRIPTGDPHCPSDVRRANQLRNAIIELMDGSDLNSPARSTRTDAAGMGGERGESSGGSDDVADNQEYKDTGVEDAPTETIDGSDTPMGEQAHRLPPTVASRGQRGSTAISSTATSSNNRRRTSTHNTPISRPRNQHRESSPEDPGNRVGNVTAMMMMSQAQFRDERRDAKNSVIKSRCIVSRCKISRT
jgi:hypothetical protein